MIYYSHSKKDTQKVASGLAAKIKNGAIALEGELGAGKTTFVQAFAKALGVKTKVKSPTFNIMKKYSISSNGYSSRSQDRGSATTSGLMASRYLYHIDCYRLKDHNEAIPLGIKNIFEEPNCFVLIEWPERISKILPKKLVRVHIDHIDKNKRKISIYR